MVILDHWFVILERQCHAHVPGIPSTLDQTLAAPAPDFFFRESFVDDRPIPFSDVVGGQLRMARNPQARNTRRCFAPKSAVIRIKSPTKQIWASRTSGTGLLKSLLAATP